MRRTHTAGSSAPGCGRDVVLMRLGAAPRDHGGVIFVDLRDREGITQVVFNPSGAPEAHLRGRGHPQRIVLGVRARSGTGRGHGQPPSGDRAIEVTASELRFSTAQTPPFLIEDNVEVAEGTRLKYRHIDLRRHPSAANLMCAPRGGGRARLPERPRVPDLETAVSHQEH